MKRDPKDIQTIAKQEAKLKAIKRLIEEWQTQLPIQFELIIRNIIND